MMQNSGVKLYGKGDVGVEKLPMPKVGDNEVLMRMSKVGLCGTDLSMVYKLRVGDVPVNPPIGLGHEAIGVVVECGPKVKHLKKDDRVTIEPGTFCRMCEFCKSGKYNICPDSSFYMPGLFPGMLARYFAYNADLCFKIPDNISDEEGATIEPLAVAVHACRRGNVTLGSSVLIVGAGCIGLLTLITAKAMGATNIILTDIKESRLVTAKKMGATHTLLVGSETPEELAKKVAKVMGCMPDISLECSAADDGLRMAMFATKQGGVVVITGIGSAEIKLPIINAAVREVDIRGVYRYVNCYPIAIDMISKGLVDVKPLITHRFKMEEIQKAFDTFKSGADSAIKCLISC